MSKATKKNMTAELESLRLPELQARFREVVGEISKSPNRKFLIRRIEETLATQAKKAPETRVVADEPEVAPPQPSVTVATEPAVEANAAADAPPATEPELSAAAATAPESPTSEPGGTDADAPQSPVVAPASAEATTAAPSKPARGRFAAMSVEELQAKYLEVVGRPTSSDNKAYLIWKIREAEKGRITVGPVQARKAEGTGAEADVKILPLRLETKVVETMDAAWRERGIKNRMEFFRRALGHYLTHLGATDAAALFTTAQ